MDEHLTRELFSNVEEPDSPWAYWRLSMPLIDEREDYEETEETLNCLKEGTVVGLTVVRVTAGDEDVYAREQLDQVDDRNVCRFQESRWGVHLPGMREVVEMAFDCAR